MSDKEIIGEILLRNVRLSFADIYKPGKDSKDKSTGETIPGRYKANGLMEKGTPDTDRNLKLWRKAKEAVLEAKYGSDRDKWPKLRPDKICVRDGDLEDWDGYANHWYISASEAEKPELITRRKDEDGNWIPARPGEIFSGCYVNILVRIWVQDNEHGRRINARLKVVQFNKKGEAFSGSGPVDVNKRFSEIEEDEEEDFGSSRSSNRDDDEDDVI